MCAAINENISMNRRKMFFDNKQLDFNVTHTNYCNVKYGCRIC